MEKDGDLYLVGRDPFSEPPTAERSAVWVAGLLALAFGLWSFLGADRSHVIGSDAARHALNGALIFDMVRTGNLSHPVDFAHRYYAHFPSVSIPYHPPLFPIIEAAFYAVLGVSVSTARLATAVFAAGLAFLLFVVSHRLSRSVAVSTAVVLTFCTLPVLASVRHEVMLDMPALVFVLASICFLLDWQKGFRMRDAILFSLLGAAAVWTKHAVFLGLVPWCLVGVTRRLAELRRWPIWVASAIFGTSCVTLAILAGAAGFSGENQTWPNRTVSQTLTSNWTFYLDILWDHFGFSGLALTIAALTAAISFPPADKRERFAGHLCFAWAVAGFAVPLAVRAYDPRYLLFMLPAIIIAAYSFLHRWLSRFSGTTAAAVILILGCLYAGAHERMRWRYLHGPADAASHVLAGGPARVLYCGDWNGTFIFAVRELDSSLKSVVFRGDKLSPAELRPDKLTEFARAYGIHYVVARFGDSDQTPEWAWLREGTHPLFLEEKRIKVDGTGPAWDAVLYVFRFTDPSPNPKQNLETGSRLLGRKLDLKF